MPRLSGDEPQIAVHASSRGSHADESLRVRAFATSWCVHYNVTRLTNLTFTWCHAMRAPSTNQQTPRRTSTLQKMSSESLMSDALIRRREVLQGLLAATLPLGMLSCSTEKHGALTVGGLPVTCNLTLPVVCVSNAKRNSTAATRRSAVRIRIQQVQRLARSEGITHDWADQRGVHAGATRHGSCRQEDTGEDRLARSSLRCGHHGAYRITVSAFPTTSRQADRDSKPLRRRLSVLAENAGSGRDDAS